LDLLLGGKGGFAGETPSLSALGNHGDDDEDDMEEGDPDIACSLLMGRIQVQEERAERCVLPAGCGILDFEREGKCRGMERRGQRGIFMSGCSVSLRAHF
jgi:hypothetical protein